MKTNVRSIRKKRVYSEEFKRELVKEFEKGSYSVLQLKKLYGINHENIYRWIYKYSNFNDKSSHVIEMKESSTKKLKDLEKKVKELEQAVGRKQMYIDYLEKMMDIAKDEMGVDIKKNYDTPQSTTSGNARKK